MPVKIEVQLTLWPSSLAVMLLGRQAALGRFCHF